MIFIRKLLRARKMVMPYEEYRIAYYGAVEFHAAE